MPNLKNSNIEKGSIIVLSSIYELIIKFVEVPIKVNVPPYIAA